MSYVKFERVGMSSSGLTERWEVRSNSAVPIQLGWISWFAAWRKYCFSPAPATIFDSNCLIDIANRCSDLTKEHKK